MSVVSLVKPLTGLGVVVVHHQEIKIVESEHPRFSVEVCQSFFKIILDAFSTLETGFFRSNTFLYNNNTQHNLPVLCQFYGYLSRNDSLLPV